MALILIEGTTKLVYDDTDQKLHVVTFNEDGSTTDHGAIE